MRKIDIQIIIASLILAVSWFLTIIIMFKGIEKLPIEEALEKAQIFGIIISSTTLFLVAFGLILTGLHAVYTTEYSKRNYIVQVLSALRPDITAAILSLKYVSWIARGIALQLKSKRPTPRCVGFIQNLLDAVHMCTEPAGVLEDYKVQVSSGRLVAYIPPAREALRLIERLTELEDAKNIRIKINDVQKLHARIAQNPSRINYEMLNMLADKLDEIVKEAEELLLTPVPKPFFEKCTTNQHPPSC